MNSEKRKAAPLVVIVGGVIGGLFGATVVNQYFQHGSGIDAKLTQVASNINKALPMMVDQNTRLDSTAPGPDKTFIYRYTLVNLNATDLSKDKLVEMLRPKIIESYKTNPDMKGFREAGVTLRYKYNDKNEAFIGEIEVSPRDF